MKIGLMLAGIHAGEAVRLARKAEAAGLDGIWVPEMTSRDSITVLSGAAASTQRLRLASCILNVYSRPPVLTAMTCAALDELSNGRLVAGIGIGNPRYVTDLYGMEYRNGLARLKEYVEILRQAFQEESFSYRGTHFQVHDWGLGYPPRRTDLPIFVGAHNDGMLRFAGQAADGCILNAVSVEDVTHARRLIARAARAAGRESSEVELVSVTMTALDDDPVRARQRARHLMAYYISRSWIRRRLKRSPFAAEVESLHAVLQQQGIRGVRERISDAMAESLTITGSPEVLKPRLEEYRKAGLDTAVLYVAPDQNGASHRIQAVLDLLSE